MSMPPELFILNSINALYNREFTFDDVYFDSDGVEVVDQYGCNSMIRMHAKPGAEFSGTLRVYYNRVNFDEYLENDYLIVDDGDYFDTDDMLPDIKSQLGINIERSDILSDIIDTSKFDAKIRMSDRCLAYTGNIKVFFLGNPLSLAVRVANRSLSNFI